jgi:predicted DsbA family dithiol-disulfide isomerase
MRKLLFENQSVLTVAAFLKHGEAIGLNNSLFQECLASEQQTIKIRKSVADARKSGVTGTPTFFLGVENSDRKSTKVMDVIVGAQPYSEFKGAIDRILNQGPNAQRTSK